MSPSARARYATDAGWARASGVPKETLSRLKSQPSCDLRTLLALAGTAGFTLAAVPLAAETSGHIPASFGRDYEDDLLDLAASGNMDPGAWRARGPAFFMGGLAVMLAGARGFEREPFLRLAEALHPGITHPEVFADWLEKSPLRASRFLPIALKRKQRA
jgi:hypothetical protein